MGGRGAQTSVRGHECEVNSSVTQAEYRGRQPARRFERPAPRLGEHNDEVLGGLLGLDAATLARLAREQIIGTRPLGA